MVSSNTTLNAANSYNGPTFVINGANLTANAANSLPTTIARTDLVMDQTGTGSSTLTLGANQAAGSLTGASTSTLDLGSRTLTLGSASGSSTFGGSISGSGGSLIKDGGSTQILTGTASYTGTTTVSGGTLAIGTGGSLSATSNVTINSGAILQLSGTGNNKISDSASVTLNGGTLQVAGTSSLSETLGSLAVQSNSTIDFGIFATGNKLSFASSYATLWNSSAALSIWNYTLGLDHLYFGSGLSAGLTSPQISQFIFYSDDGQTRIASSLGFNGAGEISPVPEPSAIVMSAISCLFIGGLALRRRKAGRSTPPPAAA